jgi:hypothetical protein
MGQLEINLRHIARQDASAWEMLRTELWPEGAADHALEIALFFEGSLGEPNAVIVAENSANAMLGFAELSPRHSSGG